ncbi:MAG: carbonic anhydrase [Legionellales bacterium RIFCSPHIGHO2_12_FULL_37_14]|nr:MAG: carbonic anhydrase [Legionellales bacterium RIFCSPHIGHO2_12_FULL_37_14]
MHRALRKLNIYRRRSFKFDFVAAIVVSLVAIPLCLGIALASNAPLFSGLLGGMIGGIVVGLFSGSQISVSGPAAGLTSVIIASIAVLGGFENFLMAVTIAGILQCIIGACRAGFIADYVPSNVVQGLLCAIGILLIIKQLPLAFTLSNTLVELKMHLLETTEEFAFAPVYGLYHHINMGATLLSILSFAILIYFDKTKNNRIKSIPSPIIVVLIGIILNEIFIVFGFALAQSTPQLVQIPHHANLLGYFNELNHPNVTSLTNPKVYIQAFIIMTVASLETLLNLKAAEKLDTKKRISPKNQELFAQGIGNLLAGLLGAIPVTSIIVRTSVNIRAGARTKFASVFHGIFLLAAVLLIPTWLNKIPLSSLAAILIFTGYKLTKPAIYQRMYQEGLDRFIPFIATIFSIVVFNLLEGILIGLAISFFYILKSNSKARIDIIKEIFPNVVANRLVLPQNISFLNKAALVAELNTIPANSKLTIDARYSHYIDQDIIEFIQEFRQGPAKHKNISLSLIGFKDKYHIHNFIDFISVTSYNTQTTLNPQGVLKILKEGNQRFLNDTRIHRVAKMDIQQTASAQKPIAVILACIDSRVPVETIFDMSFGDLFCIRIAGNVVNNDILASIEYACHVIGAKLIVVLGHTQCGAIQAACDGVKEGHVTQLLAKIQPAIDAVDLNMQPKDCQNSIFLHQVTQFNVANTIQKIHDESLILKDLIQQEKVGIVGAVYDVKSGLVHFDDYSSILPMIGTKAEKQILQYKISRLFNENLPAVSLKD